MKPQLPSLKLNRPKGNFGEELAATYLKSRGLKIIARNFRTRYGEIDLVALEGNVLVFVEVKTRYSVAFGEPYEAVTSAKIKNITSSAHLFCQRHPSAPKTMRIDVVSIILKPDHMPPKIEHMESVTS